MEEFGEVLLDVQKEYKRSNKLKDIIIIILIVLMFLQSAFSFGCFVWYESQFEYYDTAQETNTEQGWNTQEQQPYMGTQRNKRMQENIAE